MDLQITLRYIHVQTEGYMVQVREGGGGGVELAGSDEYEEGLKKLQRFGKGKRKEEKGLEGEENNLLEKKGR